VKTEAKLKAEATVKVKDNDLATDNPPMGG
jgi:hypothetical protein